MAHQFRKAMDALYLACVVIAGIVAGADLGGDSVGGLHPLRAQQRRVVARADGGAAHDRAHVLRRRGLLPARPAHERDASPCRPAAASGCAASPISWSRC